MPIDLSQFSIYGDDWSPVTLMCALCDEDVFTENNDMLSSLSIVVAYAEQHWAKRHADQ